MVVKFYNYANSMQTCTYTTRTANDAPRIPVNPEKRTVDFQSEVFLHNLNSTCFKIKKITINILFFMKIKPLIGHRIPIGKRLHVN